MLLGSTVKSAGIDDRTVAENVYQANFTKALQEAREAGTISEDAFSASLGAAAGGGIGIGNKGNNEGKGITLNGSLGGKWSTSDKDSSKFALSKADEEGFGILIVGFL